MGGAGADAAGDGRERPRVRTAWVVLPCLLVALTALLPRVALDARLDLGEGRGFSSRDPDSLYQMRRLSRFLDGDRAALVRDPYLDHPHGSAIPWPAGYALVQAALLGPGRPDDAVAARRHVEQGVASLPLLWGVLAAVLACLCGSRLAGPTAGLAAGLYLALCRAPIEYSRWGNGDHHAFVLLLAACWMFTVSGACRARVPRLRGAWLAGLCCGGALVTWVPSVFLVAVGVVAMFAMLLDELRGASEGAARWWTAAWGGALLLVVPFAATSPWTASEPWNPVYLTLVQPAALLLAGLVPVTFLLARRGAAGAAGAARAARARRALLVWGLLFVVGALLFPLGRAVLPAGLGEATSVLLRADEWHDVIAESRPLFGPGAHPMGAHGLLGLGVWLVPVALVVLGRAAWRERDTALVAVLALAAVTGGAALLQARFADLFALPVALVLGLTLQRGLAALGRRTDVTLPAAGTAAAGVATLVLLQAPVLARLVEADGPGERSSAMTNRGVLEWLRQQGDALPGGAVLSMWGQGHAIMWVGDRPTVASNFGPFTGRDGFEAPSRFYLERDPDVAEAQLAARDVAFVILRGNQPAMVLDQLRMLGREDGTDLLDVDAQGGVQLRAPWLETMAGRLLAFADRSGGMPRSGHPPPGFLRLVHAAPQGARGQAGWLFERVAGARLRVHARPGEALQARVAVTSAPGGPPSDYVAEAVADASGLATLRVPYATGERGTVRAGPVEVSGQGRELTVALDERAVRDGALVEVRLEAP